MWGTRRRGGPVAASCCRCRRRCLCSPSFPKYETSLSSRITTPASCGRCMLFPPRTWVRPMETLASAWGAAVVDVIRRRHARQVGALPTRGDAMVVGRGVRKGGGGGVLGGRSSSCVDASVRAQTQTTEGGSSSGNIWRRELRRPAAARAVDWPIGRPAGAVEETHSSSSTCLSVLFCYNSTSTHTPSRDEF